MNADWQRDLVLNALLERQGEYADPYLSREELIGAILETLTSCYDCESCDWGTPCERPRPLIEERVQLKRTGTRGGGRFELSEVEKLARSTSAGWLRDEVAETKANLAAKHPRRRITEKEALGIVAEKLWPHKRHKEPIKTLAALLRWADD